MERPYSVGEWEQHREEIDGIGFLARSRHSTEELARRAAIRLAKSFTHPTGGALSWAGGVRLPSGEVRWYGRDGEIMHTSRPS